MKNENYNFLLAIENQESKFDNSQYNYEDTAMASDSIVL